MITNFNHNWAVRRPIGPFAAMSGDSAELKKVTLPHDAMRDTTRTANVPDKGASAYYPPAAFTYVNSFEAPNEWAGKLVLFEFGAAMRHAQVFINKELAGNRSDGYAQFIVDATPFIRVGETNEIKVEVRTGEDSRWYSGAGLHRGVRLLILDPVHITPNGVRVTIRRVEDDVAEIEVEIHVENRGLSTESVMVQTHIQDIDDKQIEQEATPLTVPAGTIQIARHRMYISDPHLWDTDDPYLYSAKVSLGGDDTRHIPFGIRTVTADPKNGLRVNGKTVLLRGACIHHDNGPLGAIAAPRAEERRVKLLKAAGFNAIRSAHNPASTALLDACDRIGMLVMDEAFDMWTQQKTSYDYALDFPNWWKEDLDSLVAKDQNHPSVIMYSIGNEIAEVGRPHGTVIARALAEHLRMRDPSRLITNCVSMALVALDDADDPGAGLNDMLTGNLDVVNNQLSVSKTVSSRTHESSSVLDVLGLNYADSRYESDHKLYPHRIIVGSETFASRIGYLWPLVEKYPHVIGDFTWTGWDYLGEVGIGATAYVEDGQNVAFLEREYPYLTAQCGDLDITGFRRPVSYYREIVFGLRQQPYISVHRPEHFEHTISLQSPWAWSDSVSSWTWPGFEEKSVIVEVYAAAEEVALLVNGREIERKKIGVERPCLASFETLYQPGLLEAIAYSGGEETGRFCLRTADLATQISALSEPTTLQPNCGDLAFVDIELHDDEGRLVTSSDRQVSISVSGPGSLAGMCSANPKTTERFNDNTWTTFDGRALAVVEAHNPGIITVTVSADGLKPAVITLVVAE
jgi:Beta-galactosidase/beta-glucuronidase